MLQTFVLSLLVSACCLFPRPSLAQAAGDPTLPPPPATDPGMTTLELTVAAKGTGRPLRRAEVKVGQNTFTTDPQGRVTIELPAGDGSILVKRQGFESLFVDFKDLRGQASATVYLPPGKPDDSEVVITGSRRTEVSRKTITVRETARVAPGGDPAQVAQLLPGVQSDPGSTDIVIRGSGPNDSRYFVDDIAVPNLFHSIFNLSILPSQQLSDVEFNSGGFGVQYGDASGGIIVLRSSDEVPEFDRTELTVNVPFYLGLFHERPLSSQSSLAVGARRSTIEAIIPAVLPEDLNATVVPSFYDLYARYLHKTDETTYKVTAISSLDGLQLAVPFDGSEQEDGRINVDFNNTFSVLAVEREHTMEDGWRYRSTPQYRIFRVKANVGSDDFYLNGRIFYLPTEFTKRLDRGRFFYIGFAPEWSTVQADIRAPVPPVEGDPFFDAEDAPRRQVNREFVYTSYALWTAVDWVWNDLTLTPGVRGFKSGLVEDYDVDPRLQLRYTLNANNTIKAAVGQYSIPPQPPEVSAEFGNPDLRYERSMHSVLGLETKWGDRWVTEFQGFYKRTYRLVVSGGERSFQGTGVRQTYGFEGFIRRNLTEKLFGWLAYTYSVSREKATEQDPFYTSEFDQTHILNLAGSYRISAYWDLGTRFKYNTGSPYTPVDGAVYNSNLDKYQPIFDRKNPYSDRLPDFHSLDLFASYDSLYNEFKLKYQFGIQFLALGPRVNSVQYNYDYTKKEFVADLPPIPYFQLTAQF